MTTLKNWPSALLRRWLLQAATGLGCLLMGTVMFLAVCDRVLLVISVLLAVWIFLRCIAFYRLAAAGRYDTTEGICISTKSLPFQKMQTICLREDSGKERSFLLESQAKIGVGCRYRVYAQQNEDPEVRVLAWEYVEQDRPTLEK